MKPKLTIKLGAMPSPSPKDEVEDSEYDDAAMAGIADVLKDMKAAMDADDFAEAAKLFCAAQDLHGSGGMDEDIDED